MTDINTLKRERADLNTRVQVLAAQPEMTAEAMAEFDGLKVKFDGLTAQIGRAEAAETMAALAAVPVMESLTPTLAARPRDHAQEKQHQASVFAGILGALKHAPSNPQAASEFAQRTMKTNGVGTEVAMALTSVTSSGGAVLIPTNLANYVIERLIPNSVVRMMGAQSLPLNNGNLDISRITGGATAGYIGRDADVPVSQQTFDKINLVAKKLAALVPIGNDLIRFAGIDPRVDSLVTNDIAISIANAEDAAFIRADGTANTPKGLRYWCASGNVLTSTVITALTGAALVQAITNDAGRAILAVRRANIRMRNPGWLMHPDSVQFLADLRTTTGDVVFPEIADGKFRGYPVGITTAIPTTLTVGGATGNGSEIYFVDFAEMIIGESLNISVAISMEAAYTDPGTGLKVSAFERDQTLIRVITENDFGPRHTEAIAVIKDVTWYR